MISIVKVISIAYPFNHKYIMTRAVYKMVAISWLLVVLAPIYILFITGGFEVTKYGICIFTWTNAILIALPYAIAIVLEAIITTTQHSTSIWQWTLITNFIGLFKTEWG